MTPSEDDLRGTSQYFEDLPRKTLCECVPEDLVRGLEVIMKAV
jgi:hypothetical protein